MSSILMISYVDMEENSSGSSVRPNSMLEAFKSICENVYLLAGNQDRKIRKNKVKEIKEIIDTVEIDCCYIESPTYPIMWHCDRSLIQYIHNKRIPIGYFYRDFYRKFPELIEKKRGIREVGKNLILDYMQKLTDNVLEYCDIVYLPSMKASYLLNYRNMQALPPAGKRIKGEAKKIFNYTGIYVGGISNHYDGEFLLKSFQELYQYDNRFNLILVCRKNEWLNLNSKYRNCPWLHVIHESGEKLAVYYDCASFALLVPKCGVKYNEFAISVKMFEYMEYGLPIVSIANGAMKDFIERNEIGVSTSPDLFVNSIIGLSKNAIEFRKYSNNAIISLASENLWLHRAQKVVTDLLEIREEKSI